MNESLIDCVRNAVKQHGLSRKTENAYVNHVRQFVEFNGESNVSEADIGKIAAFLEYLEKDKNFAAATINQLVCALAFFYREIFGRDISLSLKKIKRDRTKIKLPVVLTPEEVKAVLSQLSGAPFLVAALMYGSGLRLNEALSLRVGDVDFICREIIVRGTRAGAKSHRTILPELIVPSLQRHLEEVKFLHEDDCLRGYGKADLPSAFGQTPKDESFEWRYQFIFPAAKLSLNKKRDNFYRYHLAESTVQKAVGEAVGKAKVSKKAGCQTLRHTFAAQMFEKTRDLYTVRNLLGHKNLRTTLIYTNVVKFKTGVSSPLDA